MAEMRHSRPYPDAADSAIQVESSFNHSKKVV
jgi:hypothetical protein